MSKFAEKVKHYYVLGMWNLARVKKARELGRITDDEYEEIIGNEYLSES